MPATEETYRSQSVLNIVFGVTSLVMAVVVVWMIMADHLRPWKKTQREFQKIETAKLEAAERQQIQDLETRKKAELDSLEARIAETTKFAETNARSVRDIEANIERLRGRFENADTLRRFQKADLDSALSLYDGYIDRDELRAAQRFIETTIKPSEEKLKKLTIDYETIVQELSLARLRKNLLSSLTVELEQAPPPGSPAAQAGFKMGDSIPTAEFDALLQKLDKGDPATVNVRRADGSTASITIAFQPAKPGESGGKSAFEQAGFKPTPVTVDVLNSRKENLTRERDRIARQIDQKNRQYGTGGIWNRLNAALRGLPLMDLAAPPTKIQQISLPDLLINYNFKQVPRYDRCTTCHQGIDRIGYDKTADGQEMPPVFCSHPQLTSGAQAVDLKSGKLVDVGLYLDSNGPHPINKFGCTICHGGQGSGTDFTFSSHEPNDLHQKEEWEHKYHWHKMHHWDEPMLPSRFTQSSCIKCHHQVTDIPREQAPKLLAGFDRIVTYGCTGCHTIGGEGSFGPDLTDNRPVGPNLRHVGDKVSTEWLSKWIRNPHHYRPDTRMPRFYDLTNNDKPQDLPKVEAEVHAMTAYLLAKSTPVPGFVDPPVQGDPDKGKESFFQKGCLACHQHPEYPADSFPDSVQKYARADYGPNLANLAAKFPSKEAGFKWLANWIKHPEAYHAKTLMPNLQLSWQDSADIAAWLVSLEANWPKPVALASADSDSVKSGLDELVRLYLSKSKTYNGRTVLLSEVDSTVAAMGHQEKLLYVGEKTINRLGCFGCHNIAGYENAKPIGTPLNGWGSKSPTKLAYEHIAEYLTDHATTTESGIDYDGTSPFYREHLLEKTRIGFLYQKLHRPRSYDYRKDNDDLKTWDDRYRMPQFTWSDDPAAVEEVMTFVLGLTGEFIPGKYMPSYDSTKQALAHGEKLIERYNCKSCHVLRMPRYTIAAGTDLNKVFKGPEPDDEAPFVTNVQLSYGKRANDYFHFFPGLSYDAETEPVLEDTHEGPIQIEGMPVGYEDEEDDQGKKINKRLYVQLWEPAKIRGYTFNIGDTIILDPDMVRETPAEGGDFAWLYAAAKSTGPGDYAALWNRLPPPLVREGVKVQTPWLANFLKDPYPIRPAVGLRMPRFHWGYPAGTMASALPSEAGPLDESSQTSQPETAQLANYFAARDGADFPYQTIPQRDQVYLTQMESKHKNYLGAGWSIMTKGLCIQCHAIGPHKPTGGETVVNGPDLRQVGTRFRPEFLFQWLAQPGRLVPYTAMPQNIPPVPPPGQETPGVPESLKDQPLEQVRAMRDTLLNYVSAVEEQLAGATPPAPAPPTADKPAADGGN
jgi:cbb3-type cytochrome oxidase cytochrome c subunit